MLCKCGNICHSDQMIGKDRLKVKQSCSILEVRSQVGCIALYTQYVKIFYFYLF